MVTKLGKPWGLMVSTAALVIASLVMLLLTPALAMFPRVSISVTLVMLGYYYIDALLGWRGAINRQGEILDHWKQCQDEMATERHHYYADGMRVYEMSSRVADRSICTCATPSEAERVAHAMNVAASAPEGT